MMSEKDSNQTVNRRSVLSTISGAAVASGVSAAAMGSAAAQDDTDVTDEALASAEVQSILAELNDPAVGSATYKRELVGNDALDFVTIDTSVGTVVYGEVENSDAVAHFSFDETVDASELPSKYQEIPSGTDPSLIGGKGGTIFRRSATDGEVALLEEATDISDEANVVTGSDLDGFLITEDQDDGTTRKRDVVIDQPFDSVSDELGVDVEVDPADVTVSVRNEVTAADDCDDYVKECVVSGTACAACSGSCAGAPTGIGAIACAACIQGMCVGIAGTACAAAVGTCLS